MCTTYIVHSKVYTQVYAHCSPRWLRLSFFVKNNIVNIYSMSIAKVLKLFSGALLLEKELILADLLQKDRLWLITHGELELDPGVLKLFKKKCQQLIDGEPLAYIIGYKRFYGADFLVSRSVLIPRQETEELIDHVLNSLRLNESIMSVADIGTGSGCIGITLARLLPNRHYYLVDKSKRALKITEENVQAHGVRKNTKLFSGDLLNPLEHHLPQLIVANLPYIGDLVWQDMLPTIKDFEPKLALYAGQDGLDAYRKLLKQVVKFYPASEYPEMWWEISPEQEVLIQQWQIVDYKFTFFKDLSERTRFVHLSSSHGPNMS